MSKVNVYELNVVEGGFVKRNNSLSKKRKAFKRELKIEIGRIKVKHIKKELLYVA